MALLVLRATLGAVLFARGTRFESMRLDWCSLLALAGGFLLTIGLLTPIIATVLALEIVFTEVFPLKLCASALLDPKWPVYLGSAMLIAIVLLGAGAFSLDARLFGRREIIIPRRPFSP